MYARAGAGPPLIVTLAKNVARVVGIASCCGTPTRPTAPPGADDAERRRHRLVVSDALEHRVRAETAGQLADALDGLVAALADDVRGAELARQRDAVGVAAEQDDLLGPETLRGDHPAQPDGAVADDGRDLARRDAGGDGARGGRCPSRPRASGATGISASSAPTGSDDERAVGQRDAHRLALTAVELVAAPEAAVQAGRLQALAAELAGAVGPGERRDDEVAGLDRPHVGADVLDDADELVPHAAAGLGRLHAACTATGRCRRCRRG